VTQRAGVPGPNLVAFPTPDHLVDAEPDEVLAPASPPEPEPRRFGKHHGKRKNKHGKTPLQKLTNALPTQPYIATPAPGNFDRRVPASDVEDRNNRTTHYGTASAEAAVTAKLRIQNVWERERDELFKSRPSMLSKERYWAATVAGLSRAATDARAVGDWLREQAAEATGDAAMKLHRQAHAVCRTAHKLEARATEAEIKANDLTHLIESTADRVHDQAAIVIGQFWLEHEQHVRGNTDLNGEWRTKKEQAKAAKLAFCELFGAPEIPSREEIKRMIHTARERSNRTGFDGPHATVEEEA
jgi:hypothetical protein